MQAFMPKKSPIMPLNYFHSFKYAFKNETYLNVKWLYMYQVSITQCKKIKKL